MPRQHGQVTGPPAELDTGLQVETVLPRSARGHRQVSVPVPRVQPGRSRLPRITRLMALAIKFQDMVNRRDVRDYADLARLGYVTRARITQIMNLLNLAPDIQEVILDVDSSAWRTRSAITERELRVVSRIIDWAAQRRKLNRDHRLITGVEDASTLVETERGGKSDSWSAIRVK